MGKKIKESDPKWRPPENGNGGEEGEGKGKRRGRGGRKDVKKGTFPK